MRAGAHPSPTTPVFNKAPRGTYADRALLLIEDLVARFGDRDVVQLKTDPDLDPIRDDPRFRAVVKKLEAATLRKP